MSDDSSTKRGSARAIAQVVGFLACLVVLLPPSLGARWICDDALITFRYLDNLAAGHGLVYNVGERLEAFSSPLFLVLLAPGHLLGASPFVSAQVLGLVATIVELGLIFALLASVGRWPVVAILAGVLFASDRVVHVWATGGLETAVVSALVCASLLCSVRATAAASSPEQVTRASVVHLLLASARPEGALFFAVYLGALAFGARGGPWLARVARAGAIVGGGIAALLGLRLAYYGQLLPHTYAAKVAGVPRAEFGLGYLRAFALREGIAGFASAHTWAWLLVLATPVVVAVIARVRSREDRDPDDRGHDRGELARVAALGLVYVGLGALVVGVEGGDYMTDFRFMRPYVGVLFATTAAALGTGLLAERRSTQLLAVAASVALLASHFARARAPTPVFPDAPSPAEHKANNATSAEEAAAFRAALLTFAEPGDALLTDRSGHKGYGHTLRTVDATGLTSAPIEGNFYLRPSWATPSYRDRLPGHARWPKLDFLRAEGFALITPKLSTQGHDVAEITERSHRRYRRYRFLHVTLGLGEGSYLRFFTTLSADELARRARERGLDLCWRPPMQALRCASELGPDDDAHAHAPGLRLDLATGIEATHRAPASTPSEAVQQYFGAMRAADCEWLRATTAGAQAERDAHLTCAELRAELEHMAPVRLWSIEWERPARDGDERVVRARFFLEGKDRVKILRVRAIAGEWRVTRL